MTKINMFKPTAVPQTFRITVQNRCALEKAARDAGQEFSAIINAAMSRYFWEEHRSVARASGIEEPTNVGRRA